MARPAPPSTAAATAPPHVRVGRALASPVGVLITLPLIVAIAGVSVLLVGRDATTSATQAMARRELGEQAAAVTTQVAFALDQADPLLARLRVLADPARPIDDVLPRMHDLIVGRAGVSYVSASFPDGTFRGAYLGEGGRVEAQESRVGAGGTAVARFVVEGGALRSIGGETTAYDPRTRPFYALAERAGARAWTEPYTFFRSWQTGITCTEPVRDAQGRLVAVLTVDFDVGALSSYVARPVLEGARSVVYTRGGTILAYPAAAGLPPPSAEKLLRADDLGDPAVVALLGAPAATTAGALTFLALAARDGAYLASVAPIGGTRAGVAVPLDWYVATLVPAHTLLGPTDALVTRSVLISGGALGLAVAVALVLAWNLVRMRRQVAASRAEAASARAQARELGAYKLVARLGHGGMGEVWRAEHRLLARQAAIKLIRPEALADPAGVAEIRERFRREAQTLASMRSRHTIALFDYGVTDDGTFYYVMELLDGLDLEQLVARDGAQPAARVIHLMIQACASLAEAHDAGLLHRDIKPPNLFAARAADEVDVVKLLDFGIVQTAGEPAPHPEAAVALEAGLPETGKLTQLGAMLGTPGFMAPEQILGLPLDGRADLYALGCVAWWLLAGGEVFARDGGAKILHRHLHEAVPSLAARVKGWCPPELDAVMQRWLAKDPEDRPRDARQLAALLKAIPIPPEHAWTEARAQAWWAAYRPPRPATPPPSGDVQVIMPGHTAARPQAATGEVAISETIVPARR